MKKKTKFLILLTLVLTIGLHLVNKLLTSLSTVKNKLGDTNNHYYEWRFGKVRYQKKGTGKPLLLLHNFSNGSSLYEFHRIFYSLSKDHEVYALDFLGYGLSEKPNLTYTNYLFVQLVSDFIKVIIGKKTDIIAVGDSVSIATMVCHNEPDLINKLVFINPQSIAKLNKIPNKRMKALKFIIELPIIGTFLYNVFSSRKLLKQTFEDNYFSNTKKIEEDYLSAYLEASHTPDSIAKYAFTSYISNYLNINIVHALKEIDHSIYLLYGEDLDGMEAIAENYIFYNPAIELFSIPKTKLLCHLESPYLVLQQLDLLLK